MSRCRLSFALLFLALLTLPASEAPAQEWGPERRRDPFPTETSYLILPLPYSIPGIGSGIVVTFYEANYFVYHRGYLLALTGDAQGAILGLEQIALVNKRLLLDLFGMSLNAAQYQSYMLRGMETGKNDYQLLHLNKVENYAWTLTLTSAQRRLEAFIGGSQFAARTTSVNDSAGNLIATYQDPPTYYAPAYTAGIQVDLTDEYVNPLRGVRAVALVENHPRTAAGQADFDVVTARFNAYVPLGRQSTWAFTFVQSDAVVQSQGETNLAVLNQHQNLHCPPGNFMCQGTQAALVNNSLAANTNGTALTLGGQNYLRAYPTDRFQGGHTLYAATELRLNLTDEFTPFDYLIFKGVRTNLQIAPFYEIGSVSETAGTLGQRLRDDWGVGLRFVTASGTAYRLDVAIGGEGTASTLIFNYPW